MGETETSQDAGKVRVRLFVATSAGRHMLHVPARANEAVPCHNLSQAGKDVRDWVMKLVGLCRAQGCLENLLESFKDHESAGTHLMAPREYTLAVDLNTSVYEVEPVTRPAREEYRADTERPNLKAL